MNFFKSIFSITSFLFSVCFINTANAALDIEISGGGAQQIPVAILPFAETSGVSSKEMIHQIVAADLKSSGLFRLLDTRGMPSLPTTPPQIKYPEWAALQAQAMTVGTVEAVSGGNLNVSFYGCSQANSTGRHELSNQAITSASNSA
jgi:TolB protein